MIAYYGCLSVCLSVNVSVCLSASISLELLDRSSRIFCADPLWPWRCDTLCTSGLMGDVTFGRNGLYGDSGVAIPGRSLISINALFLCALLFVVRFRDANLGRQKVVLDVGLGNDVLFVAQTQLTATISHWR